MIHALERFLEWGGVKKDVTCLVLSGAALLASIFDLLPQLPFDAAWAAIDPVRRPHHSGGGHRPGDGL